MPGPAVCSRKRKPPGCKTHVRKSTWSQLRGREACLVLPMAATSKGTHLDIFCKVFLKVKEPTSSSGPRWAKLSPLSDHQMACQAGPPASLGPLCVLGYPTSATEISPIHRPHPRTHR